MAAKEEAKNTFASNTAAICDTADFYGRCPKGSVPHWTVGGSRWIRDEKSAASKNPKTRARGRRPEIIRTEVRDGREIQICESPDTYSLCGVKVGSYPNRPGRLDWREPSPSEQGWGDPNDNYGQPMTEEGLREHYRQQANAGRVRARDKKKKSGGRKVVIEFSAPPPRVKVRGKARAEMIQKRSGAVVVSESGETTAVIAVEVPSLV